MLVAVTMYLVPALPWLLALLACGCYLDHGRGTPSDAGTAPPILDAGHLPPPPLPPRDAGPRIDASIPPSCAPLAADFACSDTGSGFLPVGMPYALPVYFGDGERCYCGEQLRCTATITAPGVLELATYQCDEMLCDGCYPFVEGRCELPPLTEGRWHVRMNGSDVFDVEASNAIPAVGPVDFCQTHPRDALDCGWVWPPRGEPIDQACHAAEAIAGQPIPVEITDFCHPCGLVWGPCTVSRTASYVTIRPSSLPSACDVDCAVDCIFDEVTCVIPPLEPGEYVVSVDGLPGSTRLFVTSGVLPGPARACNSLPED